MYSSLRAAVTNYCKEWPKNNRNLFLHNFVGGQKIEVKVLVELASSGGSAGLSVPCFSLGLYRCWQWLVFLVCNFIIQVSASVFTWPLPL